MRDPARIPVVLAAIAEVWQRYPDLRLGQIIVGAGQQHGCNDVFSIEDEQLVEWIRGLGIKSNTDKPKIICLCGSARFKEMFQRVNLYETMQGKIVLSIGCASQSDAELFGHLTQQDWSDVKGGLDRLHMAKIDLADEVLILNVGDYIGESTSRELYHARKLSKSIYWLKPSIHRVEGELIHGFYQSLGEHRP